MQRLLPVANSRLLEVHRGAGQQAVVHCSFAALAGIGLESANDSSRMESRRSAAEPLGLQQAESGHLNQVITRGDSGTPE